MQLSKIGTWNTWKKENSFLREQNTVLLERVKETNILTGRLQEMLTPLLGSPERKGEVNFVQHKIVSEPEPPVTSV